MAKVEKIETALEPHFQQLFVHAMAMPNKVDVFPGLEKAVKLPERRVVEMAAEGTNGRRRTGHLGGGAGEGVDAVYHLAYNN
jgi:uncharacterized 2Fe-2S/4Fe-4S cluster protein (DUF4445 family)